MKAVKVSAVLGVAAYALQAETILNRIGWKGPEPIVVAAIVACFLLIVFGLIGYHVYSSMQSKKAKKDYSEQKFNEAAKRIGLTAEEHELARRLADFEKVTEPQVVLQSVSMYEKCVDAEVARLRGLRLSPDEISHYNTLLSEIRKKTGFFRLPFEYPLSTSRNISTGQVGSVFGLNQFISGEVSSRLVRSNEELEKVNAEVLGAFAGSRNMTRFRQGLGEILINAFFYGAQDESGSEKHLWKLDVQVSEENAVEVYWGGDSEKQGVAVVDRKGALSKRDVIYWIERNTTKNDQGLTLGLTDNHGKGLFITREIVDRMIVNIDPGKRTEIILLNYHEGLYQGHRPLWIQEL